MPFSEDNRKMAPFKDFAGREIFEGDWICHPSGESGRVVFSPREKHVTDKWLVDYGDGGCYSRLCLQVNEKGRAVVLA